MSAGRFGFSYKGNLGLFILSLAVSLASANGPKFSLSWPTPNPAFARGMGHAAFLQKTGPDKPVSSGAYGCVRNNGYKFHEGLDLYPVKRDSRGRAEDEVFAAMKGVVRHLNRVSGHSSYGNYVVLEHLDLTPALYTLYAHLAQVDPDLKVGSKVNVAAPLGKMGNSSGGYRIPLDRSHLHFEIGLRLTDDFQSWYASRKFSSPNRHGNYSGFNLVGLDPLDFYGRYKAKTIDSPLAFLRSLPVVTTVRARFAGSPDFVTRYPSLSRPLKLSEAPKAWDVSFGPHGIPLHVVPAEGLPPTGSSPFLILGYDEKADAASRSCRALVKGGSSSRVPSEQLKVYLELLFRRR